MVGKSGQTRGMGTQDSPFPGGGRSGSLSLVPDALPPFAPARAGFPTPGLVAAAARAALGGPREALLGVLMAVRLASGMRPPHPLSAAVRRARAAQATNWLAALTLPAKLRAALQKAFAASAAADRPAMADALSAVTDITASYLDRVARSEVLRFGESLRRDGGVLAAANESPVE